MAIVRRIGPLAILALLVTMALPRPAAAFSGFGAITASAAYGGEMRFSVQLPGGPPERLELLLRFAGSDSTVVAPVEPGPASAAYSWDTAQRPITPNTSVAYRWRATNGGEVTLSAEQTILYDDDRPGLDWHVARIGAATVHWYGGAETQARHFGSVSADAAARAEKLLGHDLVGPIDIFVYDTHDDFFGALGPGAREWTGAATFPSIRTIFMWLGGGSSSYLERTMTHEVTHVVFADATGNPYHEPAKWFNEGLAVWSEQQNAAGQETFVRAAADGGRLLAFDGIAESFPIGADAAQLSYAEGATMVGMIIKAYGRQAISVIASAYRDGDGDAEALEAGTGVGVEELYRSYFASFGAQVPIAVRPLPILPSDVDLPPQPAATAGNAAASASPQPTSEPSPAAGGADLTWPLVLIVILGVGFGAFVALGRRAAGPR